MLKKTVTALSVAALAAATTALPAAAADRSGSAPVQIASCSPCQAKRGCNPCSAKKGCNPCNPCAAKRNPCSAKNPCAAKKGCNPCNPYGAK